jgi:TP901 family phage tail tape measure protein
MAEYDGSVIVGVETDLAPLKSGLSSAADIAKTSAIAIGAAFAAGGAAVVKLGADFERTMSEVGAISGAAAGDMDALTAKAREMGKATEFSAKEAGDAFKYMAMAGWDSEAMLDGIAGVMDLAAASGEGLGRVSDIVTDALTAFGMTAKDSGKFADLLAAASSAANTNVSMLGESFKNAAPVIGSMGGSAKDAALALGLMANAGIKGGEAGTKLASGLTNLVKPSSQMAAYMEHYGVSLQKSADGALDLKATMENLRAALGGLAKDEQAAAAAAIFGKEAFAGWLTIINASEQDFNKLSTALDDNKNKSSEMAEIMRDNLTGSFNILKSALQELAISIYSDVQEPLKEAVDGITAAVGELAESDGLAVFGQTLAETGRLLAETLIELLPIAIESVNAFIPPIAEVGRTLLPLFANAVKELLPQIAELVKSALPPFLDLARKLAPPLLELAKLIFPVLMDALNAVFPAVKALIPVLTSLLEFAVKLAGPILELISAFFELTEGVLSNGEAVKGVLGGAFIALSAWVSATAATTIPALIASFGALQAAIAAAGAKLAAFAAGAAGSVAIFAALAAALYKMADAMAEAYGEYVNAEADAANKEKYAKALDNVIKAQNDLNDKYKAGKVSAEAYAEATKRLTASKNDLAHAMGINIPDKALKVDAERRDADRAKYQAKKLAEAQQTAARGGAVTAPEIDAEPIWNPKAEKAALTEIEKAEKDAAKQREKTEKDALKAIEKAEKEAAKTALEAVKEKEAAEKAAFDNSKKWIEDKKRLNELSLQDELAAWGRVQARYAEGSELRIEADKKAAEARKVLNDDYQKQIDNLYDQISKKEAEYAAALESRSQAIYNSFGLFEELKKKEGQVGGEQLTQNLKGQIDALKAWSADLNTLKNKGLDAGFLGELEGMGVGSADEIHALSQMTKSQLDEYVSLWREKHELARKQAEKELSGLRKDTEKQLSEMTKEVDKLLAEQGKINGADFAGNISIGMKSMASALRSAGASVMDNLLSGMKSKEAELFSTLSNIAGKLGGAFTIPAFSADLPGFKSGLDYVPADDFPALLHRGESVLPADEASFWRGLGGAAGVEAALSAALSAGRGETGGGDVNITLDAPLVLDGREIAKAVGRVQVNLNQLSLRGAGM